MSDEPEKAPRGDVRPPAVPPPPLAPGVARPYFWPQQAVPEYAAGPRRRFGAAVLVFAAAGVVLAAGVVTVAVTLLPRLFGDDGPRRPDHGTYAEPLPAGGTAAYGDGVRVTVGDARVAADAAQAAQAASDSGAAVRFTVTVRNGTPHDLRIAGSEVSAFTEGDAARPTGGLTGTLLPGATGSARFTVLVPDQETLAIDVAPTGSYGAAVWQLDVP